MFIKDFFGVLDQYAPLRLSKYMCENEGAYDNSGILIKCHEKVESVLFSLDLSVESIKKAKRIGADTIVTHHPAIYSPIKSIDFDGENQAVGLAIKENLNVISMHLNLDVTSNGIDEELCKVLGNGKFKVLDVIDGGNGYGREFDINKKLSLYKKEVSEKLETKKIIVYGKKNSLIKKSASFCGGGSSFALEAVRKNKTDADLIITSDMPHHVIKELVEKGKNIMLITHYSAENFGFKKYCERIQANLIKNKVEVQFFTDKRFM